MIYAHATSAPTPVLDPLYATRMVEMLKGVITAGTGTGANIGRPAAGKTGTSQDWRDAWFVGFTPDLLTAVWVGNDNGAPMAKFTGGELPAAIWHRFMTVAEKDLPSRDFPWLVAEPPGEPSLQTVSEEGPAGAYEDEPPDSGPGDDMGPGDRRGGGDTLDEPPPREDDRAEIDSGDGRGPVVIHGGRLFERRPARLLRGRCRSAAASRAPPPDRGWRQQPPDYERDDEAPPPRRPPPDSSADDDPRYRY